MASDPASDALRSTPAARWGVAPHAAAVLFAPVRIIYSGAVWPGRTNRIRRPPIAQINARADELRAGGRDLIDLGQAILGLPPPASALRAVRRYVDTPQPHGYSPDPGVPEVVARVARFLREHKGIEAAAPERLLLTCGASQAFANALMALTQPGDEVVLFGPYYFDHVFAVHVAACQPVEAVLVERDGRFVVDWAALEAAVTARTRCVVLVNPSNPAGMVLSESDTARLCELCRSRGIWLISDETYDLLTFPPARHISPAALGLHDQVVVVGSFSKTFGLAGWRIGYQYGPQELADESLKVQDCLVVCAPVAAQWAVAGALEEIERYCSAAVAELGRRRDALLDALEPLPELRPVAPEGATFLLAAISPSRSSVDFATDLLERTGVISVPGAAFGPRGEGYVRLSFGNQPVERICEAGRRLRRLAGAR